MPTGYTSQLHDGIDESFRGFAMRCARGMGALITMRDEPLGAPIPKKLKPYTEYYDKQIDEATKRIAELSAMSTDDIEKAAAADNESNRARKAKAEYDNDVLRARYDGMIDKVEAWKGAPDGLKDFMLSQLRSSREFDVSDNPTRFYPADKSATQWFDDEMSRACTSRSNAEQARNEEIERTNQRNAWLAQLHTALEGLE